jgi:hypothetical protein
MSSQVVSFRFLQAVTNPVTDDQVTVGVLQWDGEHLRFVGDCRKVAGDRGRPTLRRALAAIRGQVKELNPGKPTLFGDVHVAFPVAEGDGSLLRWGQVRRGLTSNSERHFQELVASADLADEPTLAPMQATEDGLIVEPIERMLLADVRMPVAAGKID